MVDKVHRDCFESVDSICCRISSQASDGNGTSAILLHLVTADMFVFSAKL